MTDECMQFIAEFNDRKDVPDHEREMLRYEEEAMEDVFRNLEAVGYTAGAIRIDGKIEALAVGGQLGGNTITEHVEKANVNFRGTWIYSEDFKDEWTSNRLRWQFWTFRYE